MAITAPTAPTAAPTAPDRSDRPNFATTATAWATYQKDHLVPEMYGLATNAHNNALESAAAAAAAATQAGLATTNGAAQVALATTQAGLATTNGAAQVALATTQASNAAASAASAVATANVSKWVGGTNYTAGENTWSPASFLTYRRKVTGAGTVDPSLDTTNWEPVVPAGLTGEIGAASFLPSHITSSTYTMPNGGVYLKCGTVVPRTDAVTAGYDVAALEAVGVSCPRPVTVAGSGTPIAFGNSVFVTVGSTGLIKYSADGVTWNTATSGTASDLQDVRYLNSQFVAVGTTWLGTSPDGITWTAKTTPFSGTAKTDITYIGGVYTVSSSGTGGAYYSTDLTTWVACPIINPGVPPVYGNGIFVGDIGNTKGLMSMDMNGVPKFAHSAANSFHVIYANAKFVAVSYSAAVGATSVDGVTWSATTTAGGGGSNSSGSRDRMAYGAGLYASCCSSGGAQTSADGTTWTARTTLDTLSGIAYCGSLFLQYCGSPLRVSPGYATAYLYTSADGITWTERTAGGMYAMGAVYGASLYVLVGIDAATTGYAIYTSPDGVTWTSRAGAGTGYYDVAFANSLFVAVGKSGQISTSADGITWATRTSGTAENIYCIDYLNGYWVAGAANGDILYSADAITWSKVTPARQSASSAQTWRDIQYQGGKWWAFAHGQPCYAYATSIGTWKSVLNDNLTKANAKLAAGGGTIVAYEAGSTTCDSVQVSGDGKVFAGAVRPAALTNTASLNDLAYGNGKFVGTSGGYVISSADGVTWSSANLGAIATNFYGIAWNGTLWWAAGSGTKSATSADLAAWTERYGAASTGPSRIAYGNATFVGSTGDTKHVTADGYTGAIGYPMSVSVTNTTSYVKVK